MNRREVYWVEFESWRITVPREGGKDAAYKEVMERLHKKIFPEIVYMEIDVRPSLRQCDGLHE